MRGAAALAKPPKPARGFTIEGVGNLLIQLARCCQPVAGDPIVGYLTQGRGVSVHREGCRSLMALTARHPERLLPVEWGRHGEQSYSVDVLVRAFDRKWLLKDLTNLIAQEDAHVLDIHSESQRGHRVRLRLRVRVRDFGQLARLLGKIEQLSGVESTRRA